LPNIAGIVNTIANHLNHIAGKRVTNAANTFNSYAKRKEDSYKQSQDMTLSLQCAVAKGGKL